MNGGREHLKGWHLIGVCEHSDAELGFFMRCLDVDFDCTSQIDLLGMGSGATGA